MRERLGWIATGFGIAGFVVLLFFPLHLGAMSAWALSMVAMGIGAWAAFISEKQRARGIGAVIIGLAVIVLTIILLT